MQEIWIALWLSLKVAICATGINLVLCIVVAAVLHRYKKSKTRPPGGKNRGVLLYTGYSGMFCCVWFLSESIDQPITFFTGSMSLFC